MAATSAKSSLASALKSEILRLARKAVREAVTPIQKGAGVRRHDVAQLRKDVGQLQRQIKLLEKRLGKTPTQKKVEKLEEKQGRTAPRFRREGLITFRKKLGLSAKDFGSLISVSGITIYSWEAGKTHPRRAQLARLAAIRGIGKKEALKRLEEAA